MSTAYHQASGEVRVTVPHGEEPSLGSLVSSATKDLSALVRAEVELAKLELKSEAKHAIAGSGMFAAAAFLGLFAAILLTIAAAYGLTALGIPNGFAFLIVAAVFLILAGLLALIGKRQVTKIGAPERTIRTTKDSVTVLKGSAKG
jgi:hypothetical protein